MFLLPISFPTKVHDAFCNPIPNMKTMHIILAIRINAAFIYGPRRPQTIIKSAPLHLSNIMRGVHAIPLVKYPLSPENISVLS